MSVITPTDHERAEWSRMAQDAYRMGDNATGHRYSTAAAIYTGPMRTVIYDTLMIGFRRWLAGGLSEYNNPT